MRRNIILVFCFLLCLGALAPAWSKSPKKVLLKVFELPDPRKTDAYSRANLAVVEAFRKKFPHIELRAFSGIQIENMDLDAGPLMAIAGGVAPDILYVNFRQRAAYIQNNVITTRDEC